MASKKPRKAIKNYTISANGEGGAVFTDYGTEFICTVPGTSDLIAVIQECVPTGIVKSVSIEVKLA